MMAERRLRGGGGMFGPFPFPFSSQLPDLPSLSSPRRERQGGGTGGGGASGKARPSFERGAGRGRRGRPPSFLPAHPFSLLLGRRHPHKRGWRQAQGGPPPPPPFLFWKKKRKGEGKGEGDGSWGRHSDGRAPGGAGSARCVRRLDGSLVPAIRITYRVSLRSSSSREPRYPSTGVVSGFLVSLFCFFFRRGKGRRRGKVSLSALPNFLFFPRFALPLSSPPPKGGGEEAEGVYCQGFARGGPLPPEGEGAPTLRIRVARGLGRGGEKA